MRQPRFSVIIPAYNVESYIKDTFRSVENQTFRDFEVIIVNDGSTDSTEKVCKGLIGSSPDRKLYSKANGGMADARNYGLKYAQGEYLIFLDSDDILHPRVLEWFDEAIKKYGEQDIIGCGYANTTSENKFNFPPSTGNVTYYERIEQLHNEFLTRRKIVLAPGTAMRRAWLVNNNLYFPGFRYSEDIIFIWLALAKAKKALFINSIGYNYLQRTGSIMATVDPEKIKLAYEGYSAYCRPGGGLDNLSDSCKRFILSRWVLGALHTGARRNPYKEFRALTDEIDARNHFRNLLSFPDIKVKIIALTWFLSPKLLWKLLQK